jgi:hypothetical protein
MLSRKLERMLDIHGGDLHNLTICFNTAAAAAFPVSKTSESATKNRNVQQESAEERKKLNSNEEPSWQYVFLFFGCSLLSVVFLPYLVPCSTCPPFELPTLVPSPQSVRLQACVPL